jgi:hypothetical protein
MESLYYSLLDTAGCENLCSSANLVLPLPKETDTLIECPSCHSQYDSELQRCPSCNAARGVQCPKCGKTYASTFAACPFCGANNENFVARIQAYDISSYDSAYCDKDRRQAIALAFWLGWLGIHQFYLGNKRIAFLMLAFSWTGIPAISAFRDWMKYRSMTDREFVTMVNRIENR